MDNLKCLGQLLPESGTLAVLYIATTQTAVSSLVVCNQLDCSSTFRVSVQVAAEADSLKQYLYFDQKLAANSTFIATIGITLAPGDAVSVQANNVATSFNLFGALVT